MAFPTDDANFEATYAEEAAMVDSSELLAELLDHSQMSRADLARALQVSRSEITERLRGERNITVRKLAATVHALGGRLTVGAELLNKEPRVDPYAEWARRLSRRKALKHASHETVGVVMKSNLIRLQHRNRAS
ncbi:MULTISPECIES: helix-turn-helix transcriptional regulator [unclassified Curtobacterium]|uniref:helix-turn-helix domain-containing protein n=1 Tax=unclassified Curtobacterium TaxID=257496 RepID=UPI00104A49FF|nr:MULTISPECIES: helix-turn-helix transcriptional regulator [unclassified Curtobacterium]